MTKYIITFIVAGLVSYMVFSPTESGQTEVTKKDNSEQKVATNEILKDNKNQQKTVQKDKNYLNLKGSHNHTQNISKVYYSDNLSLDKPRIINPYRQNQNEKIESLKKQQLKSQAIAKQRYESTQKYKKLQKKMHQARTNYYKTQQMMAQRAQNGSMHNSQSVQARNNQIAAQQARENYIKRQQQMVQQMKLQEKMRNRTN